MSSNGWPRHSTIWPTESAAVIARDADSPEIGKMISLHAGILYHDRIELPSDVGHSWCQPRQVALDTVDSDNAPYADRFASFDQSYVVLMPVVLNDDLKGVLLRKLCEAFTISGTDHYLSASIGVAMFPEDGATVEALLKNADAAMYRAKDAGRSRLEFFSRRLNAESRRKIGIERDFRTAFHDGDLDVHYQPQFDIASGNQSGCPTQGAA